MPSTSSVAYDKSSVGWQFDNVGTTTADGLFAECLGHSAKPLLHSAKALSSAALGKEQSAKVSLLSATYRALGKAFAECHVSTRQKKPTSTLTASLPSATSAALGKEFFLFFENSLPSVILLHSAKKFFLLKKKSLPSAMALALGKAGKLGLCFTALPSAMVTALGKALFAECGTRQRGENANFFGFLLSISTNKEITYISTHST